MKHFHHRIDEKTHNRSARPVLIVAFGDSVTQGIAEVDHLIHQHVYHAQLKTMLEHEYPLCTFSIINAGVDGQTSMDGLQRFDRDVAIHQPDLLLIAFCLNDAVRGGKPGVIDYAHTIELLITQTRSKIEGNSIVVMMAISVWINILTEKMRPMRSAKASNSCECSTKLYKRTDPKSITCFAQAMLSKLHGFCEKYFAQISSPYNHNVCT